MRCKCGPATAHGSSGTTARHTTDSPGPPARCQPCASALTRRRALFIACARAHHAGVASQLPSAMPHMRRDGLAHPRLPVKRSYAPLPRDSIALGLACRRRPARDAIASWPGTRARRVCAPCWRSGRAVFRARIDAPRGSNGVRCPRPLHRTSHQRNIRPTPPLSSPLQEAPPTPDPGRAAL